MKARPPVILLFLKSPVAGKVKTRLAAEIGDARALAVYRRLVESQMERLPVGWNREILYTPAPDLPLMRAWLGDNGTFHPQADGDLGTRLEAGFANAFQHGAPLVCAIGGDCPGLSEVHFEETQKVLESKKADVVFGPAEDGGYYLVAMRRPAPELFRNIPWSSADTLAQSVKAAEALGSRVHLLPELADVDTLADCEKQGIPILPPARE